MKPYKREVNYYETDQMGIVHHSNYIRYFEEARLHWMEQMDLSYDAMEARGILIPVMFVECKYVRPLHYKDQVEILVKATKFDGIKMEFSYEIYRNETKELVTTGESGHCFLDKEMKPFIMRKKYPDLYEKLVKNIF